MALGAAASSIVSTCGQQVRVLRDAPAPDDRDDGADGERPGAAPRAAAEQDEHGGSAQRGHDHEREPVAGEPVVDVARVGAQRDEAGDGERARRRRPPRARGR